MKDNKHTDTKERNKLSKYCPGDCPNLEFYDWWLCSVDGNLLGMDETGEGPLRDENCPEINKDL